MTSDADLVELTTASTAMEAEWLVGALKGLGITAVTFGDKLVDEFAMSQKLIGLGGGVRVMVPRGELERAREALVEIEEDRPAPEEVEAALAQVGRLYDGEDHGATEKTVPGGGGKTSAIAILSLAVAVLGWLSITQHQKLTEFERGSPHIEWKWGGDGWELRWTHNGKRAVAYVDRDRNGVDEETRRHDRDGRLYEKSFDENENDFPELIVHTSPDGTEVSRSLDANENGVIERFEYPVVSGVHERWIDADEDGRYERREFVDATSGEVLDAFVDRGRNGYVRIE